MAAPFGGRAPLVLFSGRWPGAPSDSNRVAGRTSARCPGARARQARRKARLCVSVRKPAIHRTRPRPRACVTTCRMQLAIGRLRGDCSPKALLRPPAPQSPPVPHPPSCGCAHHPPTNGGISLSTSTCKALLFPSPQARAHADTPTRRYAPPAKIGSRNARRQEKGPPPTRASSHSHRTAVSSHSLKVKPVMATTCVARRRRAPYECSNSLARGGVGRFSAGRGLTVAGGALGAPMPEEDITATPQRIFRNLSVAPCLFVVARHRPGRRRVCHGPLARANEDLANAHAIKKHRGRFRRVGYVTQLSTTCHALLPISPCKWRNGLRGLH